jgi:hypothetical protein
LSSREVVAFSWSKGTGTGGSGIIDYRVSFDQGTGDFTVIGDTFTSTYFTTTALQNIESGEEYQFYVEARNAIGYSGNSDIITVLAAIIPDAPFDVETINTGNVVYFSWSQPSEDPLTNYGDIIHSYQIHIAHNDGVTYSLDLVYCDGENDQIVI